MLQRDHQRTIINLSSAGAPAHFRVLRLAHLASAQLIASLELRGRRFLDTALESGYSAGIPTNAAAQNRQDSRKCYGADGSVCKARA